MERLTDFEWELLMRFIHREVSDDEILQVHEILKQHPRIAQTLNDLGADVFSNENGFDEENAFSKLHQNLNNQGLL